MGLRCMIFIFHVQEQLLLLFLERDAVSEAKQIQTHVNCGRCGVCPGHVVPAPCNSCRTPVIWQASKKWMVWNAASAAAAVTSVGQTTSDSGIKSEKNGSCRRRKRNRGGITMEQMYNVSSNPHIGIK